MPVADKLANQRHLAAIRDGMVVAIPLSILLGGACLIVSTPPFKPETLPNWGFITTMLTGWYNWAQANKAALLVLPYNMTMALMGLFIAFISYHLAKKFAEMPSLNAAVVSTAVFLIVSAPTTSAIQLISLLAVNQPLIYLHLQEVIYQQLIWMQRVSLQLLLFLSDGRNHELLI